MHTTDQARIDAMNAAGYWGIVALHGLLASLRQNRPQCLAVKNAADRKKPTGDSSQI